MKQSSYIYIDNTANADLNRNKKLLECSTDIFTEHMVSNNRPVETGKQPRYY